MVSLSLVDSLLSNNFQLEIMLAQLVRPRLLPVFVFGDWGTASVCACRPAIEAEDPHMLGGKVLKWEGVEAS